ncbi:hypothetical protein HanXRQr2_Chr14g0626791 [Helianthus annuus]|uniref:Uncharacterized protein n=2 Tax=Helianthus annuus TaxID=4232 RepID=A0A251UXZ5_HELAN|nr:hypothetical protein HanXRQr2_Chr14g0626791 [Helianthus annuus]KAJ0838998.1 hypothetical protein HanPSC8_Chr14g0601571 [Helianthus annuus]KAJ0882524.1 hypothetical protein HanPSC8_Chr10g0410681 [Helianthus annuus]
MLQTKRDQDRDRPFDFTRITICFLSQCSHISQKGMPKAGKYNLQEKATLYFCVKDSLLAAVSIIYQHSSIHCLKDSTASFSLYK